MTDAVCPFPNKHKFRSERAAKKFLRTFRRPHGRMQAYRCGSHWHVGHGNRTHETPKTKKPTRKAWRTR